MARKHTGPWTLSELPWLTYPQRVCRSMHSCCFCGRQISNGESYFDGGYSRRAHVACVCVNREEVGERKA